MILLSQTLQTSRSWSWRAGKTTETATRESFETFQMEDGSLFQRTAVPAARTPVKEKTFAIELGLWRRFLTGVPADRFLLSCTWNQTTYPGPPRLRLNQAPTWQLYLMFTTPAMGQILLTHSHRGAQPPTRTMLARARELWRIPRLESRAYAGEPLLLSGDVLLDALGATIETAKDRLAHLGSWLTLGSEEPSELRHGFSHTVRRFKPNTLSPAPEGGLRVLFYDAHNLALICRAASGWVRLILSEPLYRFVPQLQFLRGSGSLALKDISYVLPHAWLGALAPPIQTDPTGGEDGPDLL